MTEMEIYSMKLHDVVHIKIGMGIKLEIIRVATGWIYSQNIENNPRPTSWVFVPFTIYTNPNI